MIIQSKRVWVNESFKPLQVEMENGKIKAVNEYNAKPADKDYGDSMILPGFIDIHCHGYAGENANTPTKEGLLKWMEYLPTEGVTSFLPSTSTQPYEKNVKALELLAQVCDIKGRGAEALGINMEGNFISHEFRGAQDAYSIVHTIPELLKEYQELAKGKIKTVTVAVEKDTDYKLCDEAKNLGIAVSAGHTGAKMADMKGALAHGLKGVTHTGNGMRGIHHREPGTFGAALIISDLYAEVIGDGNHIDFDVVNLIGRMKGKDRLILVTDSSPYKGYTGSDSLPGKPNITERNGAYYRGDGTLTGSGLKVNKGVYNLINKAHLPVETAINAATINPAAYVGEGDRKGSIAVNKDADLAVCDDEFNVNAVYLMGELS